MPKFWDVVVQVYVVDLNVPIATTKTHTWFPSFNICKICFQIDTLLKNNNKILGEAVKTDFFVDLKLVDFKKFRDVEKLWNLGMWFTLFTKFYRKSTM